MIFHSDRGCQYTSAAYAALAEDNQVTLSVPWRGPDPRGRTPRRPGITWILRKYCLLHEMQLCPYCWCSALIRSVHYSPAAPALGTR